MTLNICKEVPPHQVDSENMYLSVKSLDYKATHVYIASNFWDKIKIELSEEIPLNVLRYVARQAESVDTVLPEDSTEHIMKLMCEIYPERAGRIRKNYMLHQNMKEALKDE